MKKALKWIGNIVFVLLLVSLCYIIYSVNKYQTVSVFGYHVLRVLSTSMEPEITHNECIIVQNVPEEEIQIGDIITFVSEEAEIYGYFNTHRVCDMYVNPDTGKKEFITKGDASSASDDLPVPYENILGKYTKKLPGGLAIGNMIDRLSDSKLYFIVIILPLLLCLLSYIYQLVRILIFGADEEEEDEVDEEEDEKDEENVDEEENDEEDEEDADEGEDEKEVNTEDTEEKANSEGIEKEENVEEIENEEGEEVTKSEESLEHDEDA